MSTGSDRDALDQRVLRALRALYAPPSDEGYWDSLEARILARITGSERAEWWMVVGSWARLGLIAAAAAIIAVSFAMRRAESTDATMAYESVVEATPQFPAQTAARTEGPAGRGATLHYVITH